MPKTIIITLEIDVPEHATDSDISDWVDGDAANLLI